MVALECCLGLGLAPLAFIMLAASRTSMFNVAMLTCHRAIEWLAHPPSAPGKMASRSPLVIAAVWQYL